jgi:hypothetical protein
LITNELNTNSLKNILLPKFKEGVVKSGKDYDKLEKILFIPDPMMKIRKRRYNQLDSGEVL